MNTHSRSQTSAFRPQNGTSPAEHVPSTDHAPDNNRTPDIDRLCFADLARDYIAYITHERGLSKRTCVTYSSLLNHFQRWLAENGYPEATLTAFSTPVLRRYLYAQSTRGVRPRGIRSLFHPLRGLGEFLIENGVLAENPTKPIQMPKKDAPNRPFVSTQEIQAMLDGVERQHNPRQVALSRALLCTLIFAGLRAQECLDLKVSSISLDARTIHVQHGKGEKSRLLYMADELLHALNEWLLVREKDCTHDWLWAEDRGRRVGYAGMRRILQEVKCIAGLRDHNNIQCHALRRAFASRLIKTLPIHLVSRAMGHSETQTTLQYLQLEEGQVELMAEAASLTPKPQTATPAKPTGAHASHPFPDSTASGTVPQSQAHTGLRRNFIRSRRDKPGVS